jgi:hypothetical protein
MGNEMGFERDTRYRRSDIRRQEGGERGVGRQDAGLRSFARRGGPLPCTTAWCCGLFRGGEEHVGGLNILAFAVVEIEKEIVFEDVVVWREAEFAGSLVDRVAGTFELDERADGGFVEVDEEIAGPVEAGGQTVRSAVFFVAEPAAEAETFEDSLEGGGVGEDHFDFLADFVAAIGRRSGGSDGEFLGRALEGEQDAGREFSRGGFFPSRGGCFGADAEELAVLGESAVRGVKDDVVLVDARGDRFGAESLEKTKERFGTGNAEFDFGFAGHEEIVVEEWEKSRDQIMREIAGGRPAVDGDL